MAVYFDHRIEAPESNNVPFQLAWHSALPVLAVASSNHATGGNVDLYLQQVSTNNSECTVCFIIIACEYYLGNTNLSYQLYFKPPMSIYRESMLRAAMYNDHTSL